MSVDCIFCNLTGDREILSENDYAYAIYDKFPVTHNHTLVIPKRHFASYFDIDNHELAAVHDLLTDMKDRLLTQDDSIEGFNIGINVGDKAGQTIFHSHIHLIPRRPGDIDNPRGGVRNIIPGKGAY